MLLQPLTTPHGDAPVLGGLDTQSVKAWLTRERMRRFDEAVLILLPFVAFLVSVGFSTSYFTATLLFFGLPAAYLTFRTRRAIKISFKFAAFLTFPFALLVNYFALVTETWSTTTLFPTLFLGVMPFEDVIWGFLLIFLVVIFYEHFYDTRHLSQFNRWSHYFFAISVVVMIGCILVTTVYPGLLHIPYYYILIGVGLNLMPILAAIGFFPGLISPFIRTAAYFFVLNLIFELTALEMKYWDFPGTEYIGWVEIFSYRFPLEEFIFETMTISVAILAFFVLFVGKAKHSGP